MYWYEYIYICFCILVLESTKNRISTDLNTLHNNKHKIFNSCFCRNIKKET